MEIHVQNEGQYPSHTRYDKGLFRYMILHGHVSQMQAFRRTDPNAVLWDESSVALAAEVGNVDTLIFLVEDCKCPMDAEATYNALMHCNFYALLYLLMNECPVNFTHADIDEVERYEGMTSGGHRPLREMHNVVELARQTLASR